MRTRMRRRLCRPLPGSRFTEVRRYVALPRPAGRAAPAPRRATTQSSSAGTIYRAPAPAPTQERVEKHTKRDAAIGAAAGAVIGATTSRDKVKGGLIGAAVGGILGGVIGNNVDVQKKTGW